MSKEPRVSGKPPVHSCALCRGLRVLSTESSVGLLAGPAGSIHGHLWLFCVSVSPGWSTVILLWIRTFPSSNPILREGRSVATGHALGACATCLRPGAAARPASAGGCWRGSYFSNSLRPIQKQGVYFHLPNCVLSWHLIRWEKGERPGEKAFFHHSYAYNNS